VPETFSLRTLSAVNTLEAEEPGDLREDGPPIVDVAAIGTKQALMQCDELRIEVIEIAVVAQVKSGARMNEIGDQEIGVEGLFVIKRGKKRIGQLPVVLKDGAEREPRIVLIVPF